MDSAETDNPSEAKTAEISAPRVDGRLPTAESEPDAVLERVKQRTRGRRRKRRQPPGWILAVVGTAGWGRNFLAKSVPGWFITHREEIISYIASILILAVTCFLMALWVLPPAERFQIFDLMVTQREHSSEPLEIVDVEEQLQPDSMVELDIDSTMKQLISEFEDVDTVEELKGAENKDTGLDLKPTNAEMAQVFKHGEFGGRSKAGRQLSVKMYGGTVDSEKAVASGLRWLRKIQRKDGSWNFSQPGPEASKGKFRRTEVGATSLALLCFLGAGHTHVVAGPYRETVEKGLAYIGKQAVINQGTADLRGSYDGNIGMYVHGLAAICISEAHALEHRDRDLKKLTEMAINFIEQAQDPVDGGWRYKPRDEVGDTSVFGWQIMAIQSAKAGTVRFSNKPLHKAREFLKSVQVDDIGSSYCYDPRKKNAKNSMTAVALLCRMYMGWRRDNEGLRKGVQHLSTVGPNRNDMYYNYYATQVVHHWGGDIWEKWNTVMRAQLVRNQIQEGPAAGSWNPTDSHSNRAGQIYQTALCVLTLEVYYRHLPIYRKLEVGPGDATRIE